MTLYDVVLPFFSNKYSSPRESKCARLCGRKKLVKQIKFVLFNYGFKEKDSLKMSYTEDIFRIVFFLFKLISH